MKVAPDTALSTRACILSITLCGVHARKRQDGAAELRSLALANGSCRVQTVTGSDMAALHSRLNTGEQILARIMEWWGEGKTGKERERKNKLDLQRRPLYVLLTHVYVFTGQGVFYFHLFACSQDNGVLPTFVYKSLTHVCT